jgi:hypothetical protein
MGLSIAHGIGIPFQKSSQSWSQYWTTHSAIGYLPSSTAEALATPKWYVDSAATGSADGLSWANAFTTIGAAYTAASAGDVIEVSGGSTGKTYTQNVTYAKAVTVQGSKTTGHSGLVTIDGSIVTSHSSGVVYFKNLKHTFTYRQEFLFAFDLRANGNTEWTDVAFYHWDTGNVTPRIAGGSHTFLRCSWRWSYNRVNGCSRPLYLTAASTIECNYCFFDHCGQIDALPAGSTFKMNHCTVTAVGKSTIGSFIDIGNSALTTTEFKNSVFFGIQPVKSGSSSKAPVVENCFWHKSLQVTGATTFDTSNKSTPTGSVKDVDPMFTTPKNTLIGDLGVRFDDRNNLDVSIVEATTLNPEIKISHYVDLKGHVAQHRPTATEIDQMRTLIANGNEIGSHGGTHTTLGSLELFNISATGTSPTITIDTTQEGDSTTWTGTLSITINSVTENFDLTTYNTLAALIAALNGKSIGNGVVSASKISANTSDYAYTLCLADVTGQSISSQYRPLLDDTAFNTFEITEAIADLEAYINSGTDRNGENAVSGTTVAAPNPPYVCKTFATPFGQGRASVETVLQANENIIGASRAIGTTINNSIFYDYGEATLKSLYRFPYLQMNIPNEDDDTFAVAATVASGPYYYLMLYHGTGPTFGGTLAGFKTLLTSFGLGSKTFSEWLNYIRTDGGWTITEPNAVFTGDYEDYLFKGNYHPQIGSPLVL